MPVLFSRSIIHKFHRPNSSAASRYSSPTIIDDCYLQSGGSPVSQPVASRRPLVGHRLTD